MAYVIILTVLFVTVMNYFKLQSNNTKLKTLMAQFEDFLSRIQRQEAAIDDIAQDIEDLKEQIANMGLTAEQEAQLLAALENTTVKVENLSAENPAVDDTPSPENPLPEDLI